MLFNFFDVRPEMAEQRRKARERRLANCVPWDPKMKWTPELNLQAATYKVRELFPDLCTSAPPNINRLSEGQYLDSPDGRWRYVCREIGRGEKMTTFYANKRGSVIFDGPVRVPALHAYDRIHDDGRFNTDPYMSLTPMEMFTLRGGTRRAKGDVILAGLGLGHQLIEVSKRKQVKRLRIIEIDQVLVDWLWPHIECRLDMPAEVIVGNAYKIIPELTADVVLLDTFRGYGSNHYERDELRYKCRGKIGFIWAWGACDMPEW